MQSCVRPLKINLFTNSSILNWTKLNMNNDTIKIGLIGTGRIGRLHAEHLASRIRGVQLVALSDVNAESLAECAALCSVKDTEADYHALLNRDDIDAIVICSPTNTHPTIISECAVAGKDIFCEKPIGSNATEIDTTLAAVEAAGVKLMLGFNRRFDPNFARLQQGIQAGEIGDPHLIHIISRDPAPPPISYIKVSGGLFMDMTIHDFDMARFLTGSEIKEVYAATAVRVDLAIGEAGDVDTALLTLSFANGTIASIDNSRQAVYGYDQRAEAFGSKGALLAGNNYPNTTTRMSAESVQRELPLNFFMDRYVDSYLAEMNVFVDCINTDSTPPVTGKDAQAAFYAALAAKKSIEEHRPVLISEVC